MTQDAETPLNETPYLIRLNFTATQQLFSPVLPHPSSCNMTRKGNSVTLQADCNAVLGTVLQKARLCSTRCSDDTVSAQFSLPQLLHPEGHPNEVKAHFVLFTRTIGQTQTF